MTIAQLRVKSGQRKQTKRDPEDVEELVNLARNSHSKIQFYSNKGSWISFKILFESLRLVEETLFKYF